MYKIIPLLLVLLTYFNPVHAEEIPQYDVEIVLFEHKNNTHIDSEVWPLSPEMPATEEAINLFRPGNAAYSGLSNKVSGSIPLNLSVLGTQNYKMSETIIKLMESENYNPLFHIAWRQNVYGANDAQAIHITTDKFEPVIRNGETTELQQKNTSATVDGTITVSLKKYLHLNADLAYINIDGNSFFSDEEIPVVFRMTESRRMRSKEVHYFDHPKFGMLALITPYEPPPVKKIEIEPLPEPQTLN